MSILSPFCINSKFLIVFLVLGESRKPDESTPPPDLVGREEKPGTVSHKGHELVAISFHMPTTCEVCSKPLWHMFRPPPALECRRCRIKGIIIITRQNAMDNNEFSFLREFGSSQRTFG